MPPPNERARTRELTISLVTEHARHVSAGKTGQAGNRPPNWTINRLVIGLEDLDLDAG